jgi:hypothetical protein
VFDQSPDVAVEQPVEPLEVVLHGISVWDSGRLLGRIGRHVVNVNGRFMPEGDPLVRRVFERLVPTVAESAGRPRAQLRVPIVGDPGRPRAPGAWRVMRPFTVPPRAAINRGTTCAGTGPPRTLEEIVGSDVERILVHEYDAAWSDLPTVAGYIRSLWAAAPEGDSWWSFQMFSEPAPSEIAASVESAGGRRRPLELGNGYAHAVDAAGCEWWTRFPRLDRGERVAR